MTAQRLQPSAVDSPRYAVVGNCNGDHAVSHVGILEVASSIVDGQEVSVFHMGGVLSGMELPGRMQARAIAWIAGLTTEEHSRIEDWLDELKTTSIAIGYFAFPAGEIETDKVTGRTIGRKFSCAGFVHCCFKEALHTAIVIGEEDLPEVGVELLKKVWGRIVATPRGQGYFRGPAPWRVLLPSYLFHALAGERSGMPHRPLVADPCFPPSAQGQPPPESEDR